MNSLLPSAFHMTKLYYPLVTLLRHPFLYEFVARKAIEVEGRKDGVQEAAGGI